ncbi:MAG: DUF1573 domain-containing protein [Patescibacteria group bacterium]
MKKNIIGITVAVIALSAAIFIARPDSSVNTASLPVNNMMGTLIVSGEKNYSFGSISMARGVVKRQFKIKNDSDKAVIIRKMYTSCMCTTATLMKGSEQFGPFSMPGHGFVPTINQIMGSGEEAVVEVVFDPAAHGPAGVGRIERAIILETDSGKPLELLFNATVTP